VTIVKEILHQMPAVGKPQAQFLETLFATILALRGRVNFRHLSRDCDYCARMIARQFRRCLDWPDCHQRVIAYSARRLPLIPVETCHRFQAKVATDSD